MQIRSNDVQAAGSPAPVPWHTEPVRGFFIGIVLMFFVIVTALSTRPGGLRHQLRNALRRFRLAMILAGIYLASSTVLRVLFPTSGLAEAGLVVLAVALCVTFLVLSQDPPLEKG